MEWIADNWFLLLLLGGCMGMHMFMHRHGHGSHDQHQSGDMPRKEFPKSGGEQLAYLPDEDEFFTTDVRTTSGDDDGSCCGHGHTEK